jgi:hypothetical protein
METDICGLLAGDHASLAHFARRLRGSHRPAAAQLLFKHFAAALGGHLTAVRRVVYPALKSVGWKDIGSELLVSHARLSRSFAELLTIGHDNAHHADALAEVLRATEQLMEREHAEMLPVLRDHLDAAQRMALALEAEPYLARHVSDPHGPHLHVSDWLDEARLLLGGLGAASPSIPMP